MFDALRADPQTMLKRLGDGYYEQRLINEQINQLTDNASRQLHLRL
ncbi:hypothetical protein INT80_08250 [Gallibacterium anatis]|uniref:Uncharacterized protein n=1 Tax=Gallibacterium anatis TaxID=750 RepID=A0A930UW83_9PAST|nr:hypothetical protein [Gallibacterium anatis]